MFFKKYFTVFFLFLTAGTILSISTNSWFLAWLGLEMNLMSMIPLMLIKLNFHSTEAAIKYFMAQALASLILVAAYCVEMSISFISLTSILSQLMFVSLVIKAGLAPFHFWFPQVMEELMWPQCLIILTWQKIAPFMLMSYFFKFNLGYLFILSSALIGALGGLNQISMKLIMTYSSISHSAWMLTLITTSLNLWSLYFLTYSTMTLAIVMFILNFNLNFVYEIFLTKINSLMKVIFSLTFLSLAGLPPFLGFLPKFSAILLLMNFMPIFIILSLVGSTLVSLFYYMKMFYNFFLNNLMEFNSSFKHSINLSLAASTLTITGNFAAPFLVLLT